MSPGRRRDGLCGLFRCCLTLKSSILQVLYGVALVSGRVHLRDSSQHDTRHCNGTQQGGAMQPLIDLLMRTPGHFETHPCAIAYTCESCMRRHTLTIVGESEFNSEPLYWGQNRLQWVNMRRRGPCRGVCPLSMMLNRGRARSSCNAAL